jgi:Family of unknown function (DUF5681)
MAGRGRFAPGQSGNVAGRPKGTQNRATREAKEFCRSVVDDPRYQVSLRRRAIAGKLSPAIECMLWYYAKGRPVSTVELIDPARLSTETLDRILKETENKDA